MHLPLESLHPLIELHAERVQRHRHQVVLAHGEHEVEQVLLVVPLRELGVGRVGERLVGVQLVGSMIVFRERIPPLALAGTGMILSGIVLFSL